MFASHRKRKCRRGYVLVMCLFLIATAGVLLAGMARYSLGASLSALDARVQFQSHWTRLSVRRAMLDRAQEIFESHETRFNVPTPIVHWESRLNESQLSLLLMDEDAKVNVNTVDEVLGEAAIRSALSQLSPEISDWIALHRLPEAPESNRPSFDSWGQLLSFDGNGRKSGENELREQTVTDALSLLQLDIVRRHFTCWGAGRVNVRRASDATLSLVAELALDRQSGGRLLGLREKFPDASASELIAKLGLRGKKLEALRQLLGDGSESYSLSIRNLDEPLNRTWNCDYVLPTHGKDEVHGYYFFSW